MAKTPRSKEAETLKRALVRLRPIEREVLFLSAAEGLTNDDIAARLQLPVAAIQRHLVNALVGLDRELSRPWWKVW